MKTSQVLNPGQDPSSSPKCKTAVDQPYIEIKFEDCSNDFKERLSLLEIRLCENLESNYCESESNTYEPQFVESSYDENLESNYCESESNTYEPQFLESNYCENLESNYCETESNTYESQSLESNYCENLESNYCETESNTYESQSLESNYDENLESNYCETESNTSEPQSLESNYCETESNTHEPQSLEAETEERLKPQDDDVPENQMRPHEVSKEILLASNTKICKIAEKFKVYMCQICNLTFRKRRRAINHFRTHNGKKPFSSEICESKLCQPLGIHKKRRFRDASFVAISQHEFINVNLGRSKVPEKPFECEICHSKFAYKEHLTVHLEIHSLEKPLTCPMCDVMFPRKLDLCTHLDYHYNTIFFTEVWSRSMK